MSLLMYPKIARSSNKNGFVQTWLIINSREWRREDWTVFWQLLMAVNQMVRAFHCQPFSKHSALFCTSTTFTAIIQTVSEVDPLYCISLADHGKFCDSVIWCLHRTAKVNLILKRPVGIPSSYFELKSLIILKTIEDDWALPAPLLNMVSSTIYCSSCWSVYL